MGNIVNEAIFRGRIASMRGTEGGGTIVLACPVITTTRKGGQLENGVRTNFPALSFNKHTITEDIMKNFKVGNHVVVKGYVQSYLRMDERTGEVKEMMEVYIREMLHDNSKMANAFGVEGRNYPECQNEVYISAPLIGIAKRTESILSLRLDLSGERKNMVNATSCPCWHRTGVSSRKYRKIHFSTTPPVIFRRGTFLEATISKLVCFLIRRNDRRVKQFHNCIANSNSPC